MDSIKRDERVCMDMHDKTAINNFIMDSDPENGGGGGGGDLAGGREADVDRTMSFTKTYDQPPETEKVFLINL